MVAIFMPCPSELFQLWKAGHGAVFSHYLNDPSRIVPAKRASRLPPPYALRADHAPSSWRGVARDDQIGLVVAGSMSARMVFARSRPICRWSHRTWHPPIL